MGMSTSSIVARLAKELGCDGARYHRAAAVSRLALAAWLVGQACCRLRPLG
jgi:hypothetical protein